MINYKQIQKEINQKKWERRNKKQVNAFTCNYDEYNHHKLCTHPEHCILNQDFIKLYGRISSLKEENRKLKEIYEEGINLKRVYSEKNYDELITGFNPKRNRIQRNVNERLIREAYKELNQLKTKKGGY